MIRKGTFVVMNIDTYNNTTGARDRCIIARITGANADDIDRAAGQAQQDVQVAKVDTNRFQYGCARGRVSLENSLSRFVVYSRGTCTYRDGAGATSSGRLTVACSGCGDRKNGESEDCERGETREHVWL